MCDIKINATMTKLIVSTNIIHSFRLENKLNIVISSKKKKGILDIISDLKFKFNNHG